VSDPSLKNVELLIADAEDAGADGIFATPPYYYTTSAAGVREHFEAISNFTDLPLMIYKIPEWTHTPVPPEVVHVLAEKRVVVGMKYTEYNLLNLIRYIKAASGKISVFTGSDAMVSVNLEFGGCGGIIGSANVAPKLAARIFDLTNREIWRGQEKRSWTSCRSSRRRRHGGHFRIRQ
jgi:dihydrodipicolinate synthase/N-acetylneuraminate lyase